MIARRVFAVLVAVLVVTVGCGDEVPVVEPEPVVTTTTRAPEPEVKTNGWVQVGDQTFDLFFTCYSPGAGDVAAIKADILAHGPVNAGMFLVTEFEVYKSGVFSTTSADYIGAHAVTIVGWGTDTGASGKDYWLVRNSW